MFLSVAESFPISLQLAGSLANNNPSDTILAPTASVYRDLLQATTSGFLPSTLLPEETDGDVIWVGVLGPS